MFDLKDIRKQITDGLKAPPRLLKVILFGSCARGIPHDDSDIDLVVILDRKGKSASYRSLINNLTENCFEQKSVKEASPFKIAKCDLKARAALEVGRSAE